MITEENELVLDTVHNLKLFFVNPDNCMCHRTSKQRDIRTCFEKLMSFEISDEKSKNNTQKHTYRFNYNSLPLCRPAYLILCRINDYLLCTLQNHLQINGLTEHVHGNTGHLPASDLCEICASFKAKLFVAKQDINKYNKVQAKYNEYKKAQNVSYSPQQVGTIYFKSSFSVHIFGICKT
ncbi:39554_t:CDS:2, partial [Gigaspora margarita]